MTLSISRSNALSTRTPTIVDTGTNETAFNISQHDHSLTYTCGTTTANFDVNYGAINNISYVGISGHTAATTGSATVQIFDNTLLIDSIVITRNHNLMFTFPTMNFTALKIRFITAPNNAQMTVSFIAAGQHMSIESGTQAGYKRNWLKRHETQRTTTNLGGAPVSTLTYNKSMKGSLSIAHATASFAEGTWQDFLDFAYDQPFFMKEFEAKPQSSYLCSEPNEDVNSHSQTLLLDVLKLKFTVYNGI